MQVRFIPSESMSVQGKRDEVYKRYGKEWKIQEQGGGNGNWLLTKKSDVLVDGKSYRSFVLEHYGRSKLTEKAIVIIYREVTQTGDFPICYTSSPPFRQSRPLKKSAASLMRSCSFP